GLVPIRLSMVRSTRFPLLGLEAYQRAAKGENAPKVRTDGTMVAFADWNARHTNRLESTVDAMVDNPPPNCYFGCAAESRRCCTANSASSRRFATPSLSKMFVRWCFTVLTLIEYFWAISLLA